MPDGWQKWDSASIGIATFTTILAAATSAGIFAVAGRQESYPEWARAAAATLVTISLLAYFTVLVFSLASLFREGQMERRALALWTASAVIAQAYTSVLAAFLLLYSKLTG